MRSKSFSILAVGQQDMTFNADLGLSIAERGRSDTGRRGSLKLSLLPNPILVLGDLYEGSQLESRCPITALSVIKILMAGVVCYTKSQCPCIAPSSSVRSSRSKALPRTALATHSLLLFHINRFQCHARAMTLKSPPEGKFRLHESLLW
jgi:hypothetical protein